MKVLLVSADFQEAEILSQELIRAIPPIQVDIFKTAEDALSFFRSSGGDCDGVLLDSSVSGDDAVNLAASVLNEKKPIGVIALVDGTQKGRRTDLLKAGVHRFVLKGSRCAAELSAALRRSGERPQTEAVRQARRLRIAYAGDMEQARRNLAGIPYVSLEPLALAPDGTLQLPAAGISPEELVIIDIEAAGSRIRNTIEDIKRRAPGTPCILLTNPKDEDTAIRLMKAGAADCIAKTERFCDRLLPVIEREIRLREQARERASLKSREDRLRQIVELMPVGVAVLSPDGTFVAVNQAGTQILGASHPEQILGTNLAHLVPAEEKDRILEFLGTVKRCANASVRTDWRGLDGSAPGIELRAVPMRRDGGEAPSVLLTISHPAEDPGVRAELEQKCDDLARALSGSASRFQNLENQHNIRQSELESLLKEAESRRLAAEDQHAKMKRTAEEAEARLDHLLEEQRTERANWEQARQVLKEQCAKIEAAAQSLRSAQASLVESHDTEREQWNRKCKELEQKHEAEALRAAQLSEALSAERARMEQFRQDTGRQLQEVEEQRSALEAAFREARSQLKNHAEEYALNRSRSELERSELEQKCRDYEAREEAFREAERQTKCKLEKQAEELADSISRLDMLKLEFEQKSRVTEEEQTALQIALRESQSLLAELEGRHSNDLSQRDRTITALEEKLQAAEQQRASLESALRDAEDMRARLAERHSAEISQHEFARKKAEQKFENSEKQQIALQNALGDTEAALAQLTGKLDAERSQWDRDRAELEQRLQAAEQEHAAAVRSAVREAESRLAWISEQNQSKALQLEEMQKELEQLRADCKRFATESGDFRGRYQRLSQFTSAGIVLATRTGTVLECNDIAARMFGYAGAQDALGQTAEGRFQIYAFEGALDARLQGDGKLENIEWTALRRDGKLIRIQESATRIDDPSGKGFYVERILTDISKVRRLAEEIRRARRTESSGDLAATAIRSFEELCVSMARTGKRLLESPGDNHAVRHTAEAILNEANRGAKYARQFLTAVQKADRSPGLLNLNDLLHESGTLLRSLAGEDIDIQTNPAPRLGLVAADRNEMVQLIGGILTNSRETLPLGGAVSIETSNVEIDRAASGLPAGLRPGIYVRMVFSADGCALQAERRTASIRAIVERMGGCMETSQDPKLGNIHTVFFPRVEACPGQTDVLSNTAGA